MIGHMHSELALAALEAAVGQRRPAEVGFLFCFDRGAQYTSGDYQAALRHANLGYSVDYTSGKSCMQ